MRRWPLWQRRRAAVRKRSCQPSLGRALNGRDVYIPMAITVDARAAETCTSGRGDPMDARPQQGDTDNAGVARIAALRVWILGILLLGLLGTVTELVLLEHYEEPLQFVPLVLI